MALLGECGERLAGGPATRSVRAAEAERNSFVNQSIAATKMRLGSLWFTGVLIFCRIEPKASRELQ
jgi:hypothetical protein